MAALLLFVQLIDVKHCSTCVFMVCVFVYVEHVKHHRVCVCYGVLHLCGWVRAQVCISLLKVSHGFLTLTITHLIFTYE